MNVLIIVSLVVVLYCLAGSLTVAFTRKTLYVEAKTRWDLDVELSEEWDSFEQFLHTAESWMFLVWPIAWLPKKG